MTQIEAILEQLRDHYREEARQEILAKLGGARLKPVGPTATGSITKIVKVVTKPAAKPRTARPIKRSHEELAKVSDAVLETVRTFPGYGAESIKKTLGLQLTDIELPIKKLLATKQIKRRGQKRATKYYPA